MFPDLFQEESVYLQRVEELANNIRHGRQLFFVGAGLSLAPPSSLPLANQIKEAALGALCNRLQPLPPSLVPILSRPRLDRLYDLPLEVMFQFVYNVLGDYAAEAFSPLDTPLHAACFNHNHVVLAQAALTYYPAILTTNWDHLLEDAARSLGKPCTPFSADADTPSSLRSLGAARLGLVKLHGTIEVTPSVVLTMEQAGGRLSSNRSALLASVLTQCNICFVGYGMGDYDIYSTIRDVPRADLRGIHVLARPRSPSETEDDYLRRHARIVDLLAWCGGSAIVLDIVRFHEALCNILFPEFHRSHASSAAHPRISVPFDRHVSQWSQTVAPAQAAAILGALYYHAGDGDSSRLLYQHAVVVQPRRGKQARQRFILGRGYARGRYGNYWGYLFDAVRAGFLAVEERSQFGIAEAFFHGGDALRQLGVLSYLPALLNLQLAAAMYTRIDGHPARHGRGSALLSSSLILLRLAPNWRVLSGYRRRILATLLDAYSLLGGPNGNAMGIIAQLQAELGMNAKALSTASEAELICRWHHDEIGLANTMRALATIHRGLGNEHSVRACYLEALLASRRGHDLPGMVKGLVALGDLAMLYKRPKRATSLFRHALVVMSGLKWYQLKLWLLWRVGAGIIAAQASIARLNASLPRGPGLPRA